MQYDSPRLLLVQHDPQSAAITEFRLKLLGYDVASVDRGEDVPSAIQAGIPNLVLVETRLSGISGFEVISRLRADKSTKEVPIMACSPDATPESVRQAFVAGASEYLLMPFDPATLEHKVESLLTAAGTAMA